ncbi:MAG: NPCBM/NEW2 domain-containing protein [Planctomycetota bacterium]
MTTYYSRLKVLVVTCLAGMVCATTRAADVPQGESLSDVLSDRIVSASQGWGDLGLNASAAMPGQQPLKLRIKDKEYLHGLGHHANGEIAVDLGGQFRSFQTEIGVQWQGGNAPASAIFQIYVDDKMVFDSGIVHENDAPRPVTVCVEGAGELRLVVGDAGDGISHDAVDWADARLVRDPAAPLERPEIAVDVAPFALVASWDPEVMTGTQANRVQEFPAEDIAPYHEILPSADGNYHVPETDDGGCIGLQWFENRLLRRVVLRFPTDAAVPAAESVQLQYWAGASAWQGGWQRAEIAPQQLENSLAWSFGFKQIPRGTQKVRWVFSAAEQPVEIQSLSATTRSRCDTVDLRIESTRPDSAADAAIGVYNGVLLAPKEASPHQCEWHTSNPLRLKVRYAVPQRYKADRTVLRFRMPGAAFGVAIEDLLANDYVYVPHAGVFVTRVPSQVTLADCLEKIAGQKTVLEQVREMPDQDFARAWSVVHNPVQDLGPMMLSLANDNRKFIALREGGGSLRRVRPRGRSAWSRSRKHLSAGFQPPVAVRADFWRRPGPQDRPASPRRVVSDSRDERRRWIGRLSADDLCCADERRDGRRAVLVPRSRPLCGRILRQEQRERSRACEARAELRPQAGEGLSSSGHQGRDTGRAGRPRSGPDRHPQGSSAGGEAGGRWRCLVG